VTDDNRRVNIQDELTRAEHSLRAAEALLPLGLHADSVSRSYYAVFHSIRALLFSRGIEPRSHEGAIRFLNTEFIRPGLLDSSHNRLIGGLQRARELADYDAAVTFSAEDARAEIEAARLFMRDALAVLTREGWSNGEQERREP
jgi:uncharacterized protein (UPF0332 family)